MRRQRVWYTVDKRERKRDGTIERVRESEREMREGDDRVRGRE